MTTPDLPSDKLIAPLNAPKAGAVATGVQPGVSGQVVLAQYVIVFGTTGGLFVYAGSPGAGNPPVFWIANVTVDPYGNPLKPGIWAGQPGSNQVGTQADPTTNFAAQFFIVPGTFAGDAVILAVASGGGSIVELSSAADLAPDNDHAQLLLYDNAAVGGGATWQLAYVDASGAFHEQAAGTWSGARFTAVSQLTAVQPGTGTSLTSVAAAETWHTATMVNGWAGAGSGVNGLFYRLVPWGAGPGTVEVIADIINTTATGNSVCFTLPAGYRPVFPQNHPAAWNDVLANNSPSIPWVNVSTGGAIQVTGLEVADKEIFFHIFIPLETL